MVDISDMNLLLMENYCRNNIVGLSIFIEIGPSSYNSLKRVLSLKDASQFHFGRFLSNHGVHKTVSFNFTASAGDLGSRRLI